MPRRRPASGGTGWWRASIAAIAAFSRPIAAARRPPISRFDATSTRAPESPATSPRGSPIDVDQWGDSGELRRRAEINLPQKCGLGRVCAHANLPMGTAAATGAARGALCRDETEAVESRDRGLLTPAL